MVPETFKEEKGEVSILLDAVDQRLDVEEDSGIDSTGVVGAECKSGKEADIGLGAVHGRLTLAGLIELGAVVAPVALVVRVSCKISAARGDKEFSLGVPGLDPYKLDIQPRLRGLLSVVTDMQDA